MASDFEFQDPDFGFRVSVFGFQDAKRLFFRLFSRRCLAWMFAVWVLGLGFTVQGPELGVGVQVRDLEVQGFGIRGSG